MSGENHGCDTHLIDVSGLENNDCWYARQFAQKLKTFTLF